MPPSAEGTTTRGAILSHLGQIALPKSPSKEPGQCLNLPKAKNLRHRKVDSGRVSLCPEHAGYFIQQNRVVGSFQEPGHHPDVGAPRIERIEDVQRICGAGLSFPKGRQVRF